eukprot:4677423-Amphidinium_carterae.1
MLGSANMILAIPSCTARTELITFGTREANSDVKSLTGVIPRSRLKPASKLPEFRYDGRKLSFHR